MRVRCTACLILALAPVAAQNAPRFEVASVRPTEMNTTPGPPLGYRITGTELRWSGLSVKDYISVAYALDPPQIIAPEWTREVRFEVSVSSMTNSGSRCAIVSPAHCGGGIGPTSDFSAFNTQLRRSPVLPVFQT